MEKEENIIYEEVKGKISVVVTNRGNFSLKWDNLTIEEVITVLLRAPLQMIELKEVVIGTVVEEPDKQEKNNVSEVNDKKSS